MPKLPAEALPLPGLDVAPRDRKAPERWVVNFAKKPLGQAMGRNMVIVECPECGEPGVCRRRSDGIRVWEHAREFWVDGKYETRSKCVQWCRETL